MKCPLCNVDLVMSERQGIEIDYCPQCRGVWLDRGELDKIIERSAESIPAAQSAPQPQRAEARYDERPYDDRSYDKRKYEDRRHDDRRYDDDYYKKGKKKKRESFLGNLFDFGD